MTKDLFSLSVQVRDGFVHVFLSPLLGSVAQLAK